MRGQRRRVAVALDRVGELAEVRRRGGIDLTVPAGATFEVPSGETVRLTGLEIDGSLDVRGEVIVDDEAGIEDKYGKLTDGRAGYVTVGEYACQRMFPLSDQEPDQVRVSGGAQATASPVIVFPNSAPTEVGDHAEFNDGKTFRLHSETTREAYKEFQSELVSG